VAASAVAVAAALGSSAEGPPGERPLLSLVPSLRKTRTFPRFFHRDSHASVAEVDSEAGAEAGGEHRQETGAGDRRDAEQEREARGFSRLESLTVPSCDRHSRSRDPWDEGESLSHSYDQGIGDSAFDEAPCSFREDLANHQDHTRGYQCQPHFGHILLQRLDPISQRKSHERRNGADQHEERNRSSLWIGTKPQGPQHVGTEVDEHREKSA
jgi:hypothetical protein